MAVQNPPGFLQSSSLHSAELLRRALPLNPRGAGGGGCVGLADLAVAAQATPNMTVAVGAGEAWVHGTQATYQGRYYVLNDAAVNVTIANSDLTNPRIDLVVLKVEDAGGGYGGSNNLASIVAVTGTPAGSPSAPTAPANSITLAQITVGAGVSSITSGAIADKRTFATGLRGVATVPSSTLPSSPYTMQMVGEYDTGRVRVWNGSAWQQIIKEGAWDAYTPTWTSTGTAPAIGNGLLTGAYLRAGRMIAFRVAMLAGSSTTFGTGNWGFALPAAALSTTQVAVGLAQHAGGASVPCVWQLTSGSAFPGSGAWDSSSSMNTSGTANITSGNTTVTVTHGLSATPNIQDIAINATTAWGSAAKAWVSNVTSTDFRINVDANPATTVTFAWRARVPLSTQNATVVGASSPFAWASGDLLLISGAYEAAS